MTVSMYKDDRFILANSIRQTVILVAVRQDDAEAFRRFVLSSSMMNAKATTLRPRTLERYMGLCPMRRNIGWICRRAKVGGHV